MPLRYFHCGQELFNYTPRTTHEVNVGNRPLGGDLPLRLQSMTTCDTNDTEGCVARHARGQKPREYKKNAR